MKQVIMATLVLAISVMLSNTSAISGWNPNKTETAAKQSIQDYEVQEAIADFKNSDPSMEVFFDKAYGFAIFPTVGKGGVGIGGAYV